MWLRVPFSALQIGQRIHCQASIAPPFPFPPSIHKDLSERLPAFNRPLYLQAKAVLEENKAERHIRGGIATRKKYKGD